MADDKRSRAEEDFNFLSAFVERLKLEDDEAEKFISSSMERFGHKRRTVWEDGGDDDKRDGGGDFFSSRRESRERGQQRNVGGDRERRGTGTFGGQYS